MSFRFDNSYGFGLVHKFGRNADVDQAWEDIWITGGEYAWPTTASTLEVISNSANDTAAGTGARSITIEGLDSDWNPISETIATAGLSASTATTAKFLRVNRCYVATCGEYATLSKGLNKGDIILRISSAGATQATIDFVTPMGTGQSEVARYSVAAKSRAYIASIFMQVDGIKVSDIAILVRENGDTIAAPFAPRRVRQYFPGVVGVESYRPTVPLGPYPAKSDIWFAANAAAVNTEVAIEFEINVVPSAA